MTWKEMKKKKWWFKKTETKRSFMHVDHGVQTPASYSGENSPIFCNFFTGKIIQRLSKVKRQKYGALLYFRTKKDKEKNHFLSNLLPDD